MIDPVIVLLVANRFEFSKLADTEYKIEIERILNHQKGLDNKKLSNILKGDNGEPDLIMHAEDQPINHLFSKN